MRYLLCAKKRIMIKNIVGSSSPGQVVLESHLRMREVSFWSVCVQLKPEREFYCWPLATVSNPPVNLSTPCRNFIFKGPRKVFSHIIESSFQQGSTENVDLNIDNLFKFSGNWILLSFILLNTGHWNVNVDWQWFWWFWLWCLISIAYSPRPCLTHLPHLRNVEASC